MSEVNDIVNHPSHYTDGPIECYEITKYMDFTTGSMVKYLYRWQNKENPETDLEKALWYAEHLNLEKTSFLVTHVPQIQSGLQLLEDNDWLGLGNIWSELRTGNIKDMIAELELFVCFHKLRT